MNRDKSYGNFTPKLLEGIKLEIELLTRYFNLDFVGLLSSTLFKHARKFVLSCDKCQRIGNIGKRQEIPMNYSLAVEPFDVWGFDYMGPFPSSNRYPHFLVVVDYVTNG